MTTTDTIVGYSHVAIAVGDLDKAKEFYCGLLGLEPLKRPEFSVQGVWLRAGNSQLHIVAIDGSQNTNTPAWHTALHVSPDAYDALVAKMQEAGVPFRGEPQTRVDFGTTVRAATVIDPWGNLIELTDVGILP